MFRLKDNKRVPSVQGNRAPSALQHSLQLLFGERDASMEAELCVPPCTVPRDPELRNSHAALSAACSFAANSLPCEETIPSRSKVVLGTLNNYRINIKFL